MQVRTQWDLAKADSTRDLGSEELPSPLHSINEGTVEPHSYMELKVKHLTLTLLTICAVSHCSLLVLLTARTTHSHTAHHTAHCPHCSLTRCSLLVLRSLVLPTLHSLTYTARTAHNQRAQIMLLHLCVTICSLQFQYQGITACRVEMGGFQVKQAGDDGGGSQLFEESEGGTMDLGASMYARIMLVKF